MIARASKVSALGMTGFVLGFLPLLALAFFSPGLDTEGIWGMIVFGTGALTILLLIMATRRDHRFWILVVIQMLLLAAVLVETSSDSMLYVGT
jgi:hypothetical protein